MAFFVRNMVHVVTLLSSFVVILSNIFRSAAYVPHNTFCLFGDGFAGHPIRFDHITAIYPLDRIYVVLFAHLVVLELDVLYSFTCNERMQTDV